MTLKEIAEKLGLTNLTPELTTSEPAEVTSGYVSDLLSDVLANAPSGGILVTIQAHMNVLAVATHADLAGVIFAGGKTPDDSVLKKAIEIRMPLYVSKDSAFNLVGQLYAMGIRGPHA